jgi:hypothetical protein
MSSLHQTLGVDPFLGMFVGANGQLFSWSNSSAPLISLNSYDGSAWHEAATCGAVAGLAAPIVFVAPNRFLRRCGNATDDLELDPTTTEISTATSISGTGHLVQLSPPDQAAFVTGDMSTANTAQIRSAAGWVTQSIPVPPGSVIGGHWPRLIASDGQQVLAWLESGAWHSVATSFYKLDLSAVHSTDGWNTTYAIVRGGSLMRCDTH